MLNKECNFVTIACVEQKIGQIIDTISQKDSWTIKC